MKYLVIIYGNQELWESWSADETAEAIATQDAYNHDYMATGELIGAYGLADVVQAKLVSVRDGLPAVTDGPYIEAKEYLSSFYLLDVASEERALELAALIPFASFRSVEVRPILHEAGAEM